MKKKEEQKQNAYQLLLWNDDPLTEEKRMWMSVFKLEEGQDRLRKGIFRKIGEMEREYDQLRESIYELKAIMTQRTLFEVTP